MRVSRVSSINNGIVPIEVSSMRANSSRPAFGYKYNWWQAQAVKKFLPHERRGLYDGEMLDDANALNAKVATDNVMTRAFKDAKTFMFRLIATKIIRVATAMGNVLF